MIVQSLYRYPIKGLSPEKIPSVVVRKGEVFPGDRQYAFARSSGLFDPDCPAYLPKTNFLMLQRDENLAALVTRFNPDTKTLSIKHMGGLFESDLSTKVGRQAAEEFLANYLGAGSKGAPHLEVCPGHTFSDLGAKVVSLVNLESIRHLSRLVGADLDPLRFRANIYFNDFEAWHELDLVGRVIKVGSARLEIVKKTQRCAAINVNLTTAVRDQNLPKILMTNYGHTNLGIYARVVDSGTIEPGDEMMIFV